MKGVLLVSAGILSMAALGAPATAADLSRRDDLPQTPIYALPYGWTGPYVGIIGGGAWGHSQWDSAGGFNLTGGLVGGAIGYNWQTSPLVFGIESDLDWTNIGGTTTAFCPLGCKTSNSWLGTVRGRVGYALDRIMPYVTGGLAFGGIKASTPGFAGNSGTNAGWTLGSGLEVVIAGSWTAKAEYLFVDLGHVNCGLGCGALVNDNVSFRTSIVRGGLNYRF